MSIIKTVTDSAFIDELLEDEYASWDYESAKALFDYYWDLSEDLSEPLELDRVAIRCDWGLADNFKDLQRQYDGLESMDEVFDHTTVIELKGDRFLYMYW
jgi:hypothetical protein